MENRPSSGRLTFLGTPSSWIKELLGSLHKTASIDTLWEPSVAQFLANPVPKNRVSVVAVEQSAQSRELIAALRKSGRSILILWFGKAFTKDELLFAIESRVHTVIENPLGNDTAFVEKIRRAFSKAESAERSEDLMHSIKSLMLQLGDGASSDTAIEELKTGLMKFEKAAVANEFLGHAAGAGASSSIPFYKAQAFADALLSVQDLERTGVLRIKGKEPQFQGRVSFLQGRPVGAVCGEARSLKAIYRMFLWENVDFTFERQEAAEMSVEEQFPVSLREICLEGESLHARFEKIRQQVPPAQLKLQLEPSTLKPTTSLDRAMFSTLSSVVELGKVAQILDYNPLPDVVLYECLIGLKRQGVIRVTA